MRSPFIEDSGGTLFDILSLVMARRLVLISTIVAVCAVTACGSAAPSTNVPAPGPTAPTGPFANLAGTWTGTLESANAPTEMITLTVAQGGSCVDGAWISSSGDWKWAISGVATADAFGGFMSFERPGGDDPCNALGTASGPAGDSTFSMTVQSLKRITGCTGALPSGIVVTLHR